MNCTNLFQLCRKGSSSSSKQTNKHKYETKLITNTQEPQPETQTNIQEQTLPQKHSSFSFILVHEMATLRIPDVVPSPSQDCDKLKKSFQGLGTDEKCIIKVLGHRTEYQRKKIKEEYNQLYNKELVRDLKDELSGDFGRAVVLWMYDPAERDARLINGALKSRKKSITQLQVIAEVACASSSPHHLVAVRKAYCSLFDCSLEEDIIKHVTLPVQKILVGLVSSYRFDKEVVDQDVANSEAAQLHEAIKRKKLEHDGVVWILSTRNLFQLRATFDSYNKNYGNHIDEDIMSCGKGIVESLWKVVVWCIESPEKHFAEVIRASIVGLGTDEDSLTRAIVSRAEIDLMKVRGEYFNMNKTSMDNAVIGDTSGDYQDFLLTLLGAKI